MSQVFGLADIDNCYASIETLFRPDLKGRPIIVASSAAGGCVVARSREAKALGIKMGQPLFQLEKLIVKHQVVVFASNFVLYGDMSQRVMSVIESMVPSAERYSIDETFLNLSNLEPAIPLLDLGREIRATVLQWTGMTVCVGIAPTKTLAKLANRGAKRYPATGGVVDLRDPGRQRKLLGMVPVEDVWGVGRRLTEQLERMGIRTALKLAEADPKWIRRHFSVVLERTVRELQGESCLSIEEAPAPKQQILCSRSFADRICTLPELRQAVVSYAAQACARLRKEGQRAQVVNVFIRTSLFNTQEPRYSNGASSRLVHPSSDTRQIVAVATRLLESLWRDGYRYSKAGVMLSDFTNLEVEQCDLFSSSPVSASDGRLMEVLDSINQRGVTKVWFAGQGDFRTSRKRGAGISPAYTTRWSDLPRVS